MTLNEWQRVAREFGDHHIGGWHVAFVKSDERHTVGEWLPSEPTAKEILRLRKRVEVLEAVLDAADSCCHAHEQVPKVAPLLHFAIRSLRAAIDDAKEAADG